jgi:hypothetical protein
MPSLNQIRDTPGRMLMLWAVLFTTVVIFAWRVHHGRDDYDWVDYPSGLGDTQYYETMIGENDFFTPNLKWDENPKGLYRRTFKPRLRADSKMRKVALDTMERHYIYTDAKPSTKPRRYLKSGENAYIEFGERKYYPPNPDPVRAP